MDEINKNNLWCVSLNFENNQWCAAIEGIEDNINHEYAFYLMRESERVDKKWYSNERMAYFQDIKLAGSYHVLGFVRHIGSKKSEWKKSNTFFRKGSKIYDLSQWKVPIFNHAELIEWDEDKLQLDGIHRFPVNGSTIDIRADGMKNIQSGGVVLVCFDGAIPSRTEKVAPFFAGLGVAGKLRIPVLAIADPSIALSQSLALAWYAGNQFIPDLQNCIANILDNFSKKCGVSFLLFGGSGGGFASLAILSLLNAKAKAAVWNPQTSITKYSPAAVKNYAEIAFNDSNKLSISDAIFKIESSGVVCDLKNQYSLKNKSIVYLQNKSDVFHVTHHTKPFIEKLNFLSKSEDILLSGDDFSIWFGDWGKGHAVPPSEMIIFILRYLSEGGNAVELACELDKNHLPYCQNIKN